eukprot:6433515-Prymnesium_polylepis.1
MYHPLTTNAVRSTFEARLKHEPRGPSALRRIVWFTRGEELLEVASGAGAGSDARTSASNGGRRVTTYAEVRAGLEGVARARGLALSVVSSPPVYALPKLYEWWSDVRLLVGAHGSALYNGGFFGSRGADVVELMASNQEKGGKASSWMFASMHNIRFSRVFGMPLNASLDGWDTDIVLDAQKLIAHVERLLDRPPGDAPQYSLLDGVPEVEADLSAYADTGSG